jgi:hypothetical protein
MTSKIGKEESLIQFRMTEFEQKLDSVVKRLYPEEIEIDTAVDKLLKMSYHDLVKIPPDDCSIGSFKLKQYAIYIQQKENRCKSVRIWLKSCLDTVIGKYAKNYGDSYTKYEEKRAGVISDNAYAKELNNKYIEYLAYENELNMLCGRITELSRTLSEIRQNKRERND